MELMRKNPEGLQGEINVNEKTLLYSVKLLEDGSYIQSYANITELRKKEKELVRLQEGLEQMGTGMAFWDKNDKLIYANKNLRDFQKNIGFNLEKSFYSNQYYGAINWITNDLKVFLMHFLKIYFLLLSC